MSVKILVQENIGLPLTEFEPMRLAILRLLVRRINHSITKPHIETSVQGTFSYACTKKRGQTLFTSLLDNISSFVFLLRLLGLPQTDIAKLIVKLQSPYA